MNKIYHNLLNFSIVFIMVVYFAFGFMAIFDERVIPHPAILYFVVAWILYKEYLNVGEKMTKTRE